MSELMHLLTNLHFDAYRTAKEGQFDVDLMAFTRCCHEA